MVQPEGKDLAQQLNEIEQVAKQEAKKPTSSRRPKPTKEEDQLFGHRQRTRTVWHCIKITFLVAFALIVLASVLSLFWNSFAPSKYRWLTSDQLADAQKFLFSGTIGAALSLGVTTALRRQD